MVKLGVVLFKLLSKALGLNPTHLIDMECCRGHALLLHYYPLCPEPNLALGTSRHSDPSFLTILLQDQLGGLQVLHNERWVDVSPLPEAFVVNVGDLLQVSCSLNVKGFARVIRLLHNLVALLGLNS